MIGNALLVVIGALLVIFFFFVLLSAPYDNDYNDDQIL